MKATIIALFTFLTYHGICSAQNYATIGQIKRYGAVYSPRADPIATGIQVSQRESPLLLRVRVGSVLRGPWEILFSLGPETARLTSENLSELKIAENLFQIALKGTGNLSITFSPGAPAVTVVEGIRFAPAGTSLQLNGRKNLMFFDADFSAGSPEISSSKAVAQLRFDLPNRAGIGACTAFQFAPRYFITNLHCVQNAYGNPMKNLVLAFDVVSGNPLGSTTSSVAVIAKGTPAKSESRAMDFAVLEVEKGAFYPPEILALSEQQPITTGAPLDLIEQWSFESPVGKALSRDSACKVVDTPSDDRGDCPSFSFKHECDTESGSSGSPVLSRSSRSVIGLHYYGISEDGGSCAIKASSVLSELKRLAVDGAIPTELKQLLMR